jgi:cell surface protein SprA
LEVRDLYQGEGRFANKNFYTRPIDLLNYKIVKLFVNCDSTFNYVDTSHYAAAFVVRLGSDSLNYYEYRSPCHPDRRPGSPWNPLNEVTINLADLTLIKQLRTSIDTVNYFPVANGPPGAKFGILGNPTITSIRVISLGVVNNYGSIAVQPIRGSVWFNELRVLKTNDKSGYAFTLGAALKLADLANINFSYSKVDPNFHSLETRFGSRKLANSWDISGSLNLHKIINSLLSSSVSVKFKDFFTIPINFSHSEVYDKPTYLPDTDIDLETAVNNKLAQFHDNPGIASYYADQVRIASQTLRITNRFSINGFKFTYPSDNFFVREIVNKIEVSYYRNSITERTPISESKYAWDMGGNIGLSSTWSFLDDLNLNIGKFIPLGEEYKNAKLYFFFPFFPLSPLYANAFSVGTSFTRSRGNEQLRNQLRPNPTSRSFNANRNFSMDWKFIENWIIDITGNYSFGAGSDLTYLETLNDSLKTQRSEGEIIDDIFFNKSLINFGKDLSYTQSVSINPRFNFPVIKNFVDLTTSYRSQYSWQPSLQTVFTGNTVGYTADFQSSAQLNIKQILDLFKADEKQEIEGGSRSIYQDGQEQSFGNLLKFLGTFIPNQLNLTFSQSKTMTNSGIGGRPGFTNFWMMFNSKDHFGPSRLYQLGWSNDPGPRVPFVSLSDNEGYSNILNISTYINPIFPDYLKISFTYKTSWSTNKLSNYITDATGGLGLPASILSYHTVTRPSFLFSSDIIPKLAKPNVSNLQAKEISESFENEVLSFPFPGWNLTLSGIEKFEMFSNFASNISFENAYSTDYKKITKYTGIGEETVETQNITSGFNPLIGLNVTFKQIEGGALTASLKISKTNNYDLTPSSQTINNTSTSDLSINASYTKSGFKIPLFGLSLDNDLSIAFSYTRSSNDPRLFRYSFEEGIWHDDALNGSISTSINPSIQYALSRSVTVQVFYKYTKIEPSEGSQQIPTRKSNEAGLNIRLAIQ